MARYDGDYYDWRPYVSQADRRRKSARMMQRLRKAGHTVQPIEVAGRKIATTFWGTAWCDNLESYSDFENRLPRGRTYVRNGSVIDLQIASGEVRALVSGSEVYQVSVTVGPVAAARWRAICATCAGRIDSLVELLQGRFSHAVMEHLCKQGTGLFPAPREIQFTCTCPDWASMCKHVAAVLYGIGARLDHQPALLFRLRKVDERELLARAGEGTLLSGRAPAASRVLHDDQLGEVFGVDLVIAGEAEPPVPTAPRVARPRTRKTRTRTPARRTTKKHEKPKTGPGVRGWTAAQRKTVSERMKRYWDKHRRHR